MSLPSPTTAAGLTVGPGAITAPVWFDWIPPAYQALVAVLGLIVLILTIRKLLKENAKLDRERDGGR